jgi:hypothetical protein
MDYMAMGSYPYPSSYILNGDGMLPAYPIREMCRRIDAALPQRGAASDTQLIKALVSGVGVFYNYSLTQPCYSIGASANAATTEDANFWDYLYCTEMLQANLAARTHRTACPVYLPSCCTCFIRPFVRYLDLLLTTRPMPSMAADDSQRRDGHVFRAGV